MSDDLLSQYPCEKNAPWPQECTTADCTRDCPHNVLVASTCPCCGHIFGCYCVEYPHPKNPLCPGNPSPSTSSPE